MNRSRHQARVWPIPILIGLLSGVGLVIALLDDGIAEVLAWIALGLPVVVSFWCLAGLNPPCRTQQSTQAKAREAGAGTVGG